MSETPQGDDARRIVDELEEKHVDVQGALDASPDEEQENLEQKDDAAPAEDQADEVPGSPEPTD
ncbi:hypothetical protein [Nocardioides caldifontis]|uniref:hypothetical protein n=1 Tax=Nocardioides caldifontis TaxID=2588938 RepID=UPI0011DFFB0B|nr:hypothetical protein [Nocardioides caldifontis]